MRHGLYGLKGANFHLLELELGVTSINRYTANLQYKLQRDTWAGFL